MAVAGGLAGQGEGVLLHGGRGPALKYGGVLLLYHEAGAPGPPGPPPPSSLRLPALGLAQRPSKAESSLLGRSVGRGARGSEGLRRKEGACSAGGGAEGGALGHRVVEGGAGRGRGGRHRGQLGQGRLPCDLPGQAALDPPRVEGVAPPYPVLLPMFVAGNWPTLFIAMLCWRDPCLL